MLKKRDFIRVKPDTRLDSGKIVNGWAGEIHEVYSKEKTCFVVLDAPTINSFDEDYLRYCIKEGSEPFEYIFNLDDLVLGEERGTYEETLKALDRLADRVITLEEEMKK